MQLDVYQIDAFSDRPFAGNPAGVVPLKSWLPDAVLQSIAAEINQAETAFFAPEGDHYRIRWFTPTTEVKLCGHATLASAHVLHALGQAPAKIVFDSLSGPLSVAKAGPRLELDFPRHDVHPQPEALAKVAACFDVKPVEMHVSESYDAYLALYEKAADIARLTPDFAKLNALDRTVIVTARGDDGIDFVSRYFAPTAGIPEDPVTGSTHCVLATFWSRVLGKTDFHARQVSKRGGDLWLKLEGDRVKIAGHSTAVMQGTISV
ncbi:PhzF family phenazine biosynthesis protein [Dongia sedimenti]|uniref:PhzF family phenazine biosynthesis protein n=1 Tax=Dongia sedimenti TaxID=3064282 RepID=A0ABU0YFM2_9PROT|nr:PhzF family phenazine biosynthesis protein [Rhodospirillaceae bacterium R-7]